VVTIIVGMTMLGTMPATGAATSIGTEDLKDNSVTSAKIQDYVPPPSGIPIIGGIATGIQTVDIANNAITTAKLAANAVTNDKVSGIDASKIISGTLAAARIPALTATQIPALDAAKIATGTLSVARIPGLDASKITSGTLAAAQIPALDAGKIATGVLSADRIPMLNARQKISDGTITEPQIDHNAGLSAEILMHGMLNPDRVPPLYKDGWTATGAGRIDASFIGTGTYKNWVAGMPASMITGLSLTAAQIPALDAGKITSGLLNAAQIPGLDAAKIISGTFGTARLTDGAVTSAKILDGTITSADIQDDSITTNDIKDHSIQGPDIIAGTIGTGELTNGAITTGKISDGAVTSAKLAKHYLAGESIYNGKGFKIAQDIDNKGIRAPASCTCSVPTLAYTCNCWVVEVMIDEVSVYAYAYDKGGNDMAKTATIDWIVVEQ